MSPLNAVGAAALALAASALQADSGERFLGNLQPFQEALDSHCPDDHLDFTTSTYPSELDRAVSAGQLATAQIMLLDEVLQAAEDDAACSTIAPRESQAYETCTVGFYALPPLLERLGVPETCHPALALPERVTCLLLLEVTVQGRRSAMQTHPIWTHELLELDKRLAKLWYDNGGPPASAWQAYPEAARIATLDSLLIHVAALDIATLIQAAEMFDLIHATAEPTLLGVRADPFMASHDLQNRRTSMMKSTTA